MGLTGLAGAPAKMLAGDSQAEFWAGRDAPANGMTAVATHLEDGVAVLTMDKPPVNAFGAVLRRALWEAIDAMDRSDEARVIVLHGRGRGFSAGGDIHEFGTPAAQAWPGLSSDLHPRIEACRKPVIAAVHGFCLGGGLETAMACHWRVVSAGATVGLPEVLVGALPLSGTQRLPRLIGLKAAAQHIAAGKIVEARTMPALASLMLPGSDQCQVVQAAIDFARSPEVMGGRLPLLRHQPVGGLDDLPAVQAMVLATPSPIVRGALQAVLAAAKATDFDAGMHVARALYDSIMVSADSVGLQRSFGDAGRIRP